MTLAGKVHQGDTGQGRKPLVEVPANSPEDGCHMVRTRRENYQDQKPLPLCFVPPAPSSGKALPDSQIRVFISFSHKRPDMSWLSADSPQAKSSSWSVFLIAHKLRITFIFFNVKNQGENERSVAHKAWNVYFWWLYRKSLPSPGLRDSWV